MMLLKYHTLARTDADKERSKIEILSNEYMVPNSLTINSDIFNSILIQTSLQFVPNGPFDDNLVWV